MKTNIPYYRSKVYLAVIGNSYPIKNELKKLGFKFSFDYKVWFILRNSENVELAKEFIEQRTNCQLKAYELLAYANAENQSIKKDSFTKTEVIDHDLTNKKVELNKWYATTIANELKNDFSFRNIQINKVYKETQKAILVDFSFYGGIMCSCGVCGKTLTNEISKATGIGPICAEKIGLPKPTLSTAKETIKLLESKISNLKSVEKKWIPKSQIKNIL